MNTEELLSTKVLVVNKLWQAVDETPVSQALCDMCSGKACGFDMLGKDMMPVPWNVWVTLPIREGDRKIMTLHGPIRIPTVVGKFSFEKMPKRKPKMGHSGIKARDRATCVVTGEYAPDGNVDHFIPQSRGGPTSWENCGWMKKELNSAKGNKTLEEMGWKLRKKIVAPKELPASAFITPRHPDWLPFLKPFQVN